MASIDTPTTREKLNLLWTIGFILEESFTSFCEGIKFASWKFFCTTLFKFDSILATLFIGNCLLFMASIFGPSEILPILKGLFLSLSGLIGLPVSRFHVCSTYIAGTPTLPQHEAIFSQAGLAGQGNRSSLLGYGEGACESPRWDVNNESGITMGIITHFPRTSDDVVRYFIPKRSSQRVFTKSNGYFVHGLSTSCTTLSAKP